MSRPSPSVFLWYGVPVLTNRTVPACLRTRIGYGTVTKKGELAGKVFLQTFYLVFVFRSLRIFWSRVQYPLLCNFSSCSWKAKILHIIFAHNRHFVIISQRAQFFHRRPTLQSTHNNKLYTVTYRYIHIRSRLMPQKLRYLLFRFYL